MQIRGRLLKARPTQRLLLGARGPGPDPEGFLVLCREARLTWVCAWLGYNDSKSHCWVCGDPGSDPTKVSEDFFHMNRNQFWVSDVLCSHFLAANAFPASLASVSCTLPAFCLFVSVLLSKIFRTASVGADSSVHLEDRL